MPVGNLQSLAEHLMNPNQEFRRVSSAEHFLNEPINLWIPMGINVSKTFFLFVKAITKKAGGIGVVEDVAARFQFHFEFRDAESPGAEGLHQAAFEIEKTQQTPGIF